jgi:glyoxylase-like metal-dependent hydrolase (beta-lactamase superfamily II)
MTSLRAPFTVAILALGATLAFAQGAPDFSKVEIKATKITDKFFTLEGQGGTIGVLIGPDGVFMVDTQFAPLSDKIAAAVKQLTPQPIKFIVNTHVHGDHTGGDENFGKMGATIISREELRFRLAHPNPQANGQPGVATAAVGLPKQTYREKLTLHMNGEEVQLIAIPRAHTDGDTMVYFPGLDIIMTGDFYRAIQYPNVDRANGGSLQGLIDGLGEVIGHAGPNTKIIPGHGPTVDRNAVIAHRDVASAVRDRVAALVAQGKSEDEVVAAKVIADLDAKIQQPGTTGERFVRQAYADLRATR